MVTLTIDIPDEHLAEVIAKLKELGVTIRESPLHPLDDETAYLLKSSRNAERIAQALLGYKNGLAKERSLNED